MNQKSLFVGHYKTPSESKKDERSLRNRGIASFLFCINGEYTLNITTGNEVVLERMAVGLRNLGYDAFISEKI